MIHALKTEPAYFEASAAGIKGFEVRKNDRNFQVGDILTLKEWDNIKYSGKEIRARVVYLLNDKFIGVMPGYVVLGIELVT